MKLEYSVYGKKESKFFLEIPHEDKDLDYFVSLESLGYRKSRIGEPYFYNDSSHPCVEIVVFSKQESSIVELWDHCGCILSFYCINQEDKLEVLSKFISMMNDLMSVEYMNRIISKENENED